MAGCSVYLYDNGQLASCYDYGMFTFSLPQCLFIQYFVVVSIVSLELFSKDMCDSVYPRTTAQK